MDSDSPKLRGLHGLRARLELDASLGSPFAGIVAGGTHAISRHIQGIVRQTSSREQPASTSAGLPVRERVVTPPAPVAEAVHPSVSHPRPQISVINLIPEPEAAFSGKDPVLEPVRQQALQCSLCGLCEKRTTVVWGEGSLDARVMFIGEGPGRDEDLQGRPFVGRSGRVLTDIIEKGMKQPRGCVYITNVVKCRPPGNRDPRPDEVAACNVYLSRQIEAIKPSVIVAVGGVAGCALLGLPPKSPGLRGKWHEYNGIPLRVIFHPSYLLRQRRSEDDRTEADRETWTDILDVMKKADAG
jgi:uracil-DNA glycosylase, family 4